MAKFSVGGDDDEEGTSSVNPTVKRPRLHFKRYPGTCHPPVQVFYSSAEEEEEEEEEDEEHHNRLTDRDSDSHSYPFSPRTLASTDSPFPQGPEGSVREESPSLVGTSTETEPQPQPQPQPQPRPRPRPRPRPPVWSSNPSYGSSRDTLGIRTSGSISVTLTDTDVLDCPVCWEPFTVPVFQCENGHTACSSCCRNLAQRCPSCTLPIGYSRCRAIEKVIESVAVSCYNMPYGCKEMIAYSKKFDHEKTCIYAPCCCPHLGCNFITSSNSLYLHFTFKHAGSSISFQFSMPFPIYLTFRDKFLVLREEKEGVLFIVHNKSEPYGNAITISCIGPSSLATYSYALTATKEKTVLRFRSAMANIYSLVDDPPSMAFLVPRGFFGSNGGISMDLSIWRNRT